MTAADYLAQAGMLAFLILAFRHRHLLDDMADGNVCRLEREEAEAQEAREWLLAIERGEIK